jgi:hypothetical protein
MSAVPTFSAPQDTFPSSGPLRVGMSTGSHADGSVTDVQPEPRTGRAKYLGSLLNHAARVASCAQGGQARTRLWPQSLPKHALPSHCKSCYVRSAQRALFVTAVAHDSLVLNVSGLQVLASGRTIAACNASALDAAGLHLRV